MVGGWLVDGWWMVGRWLVDGWWMVGGWLVDGWWMVGRWLVDGWSMVGGWMIDRWYGTGVTGVYSKSVDDEGALVSVLIACVHIGTHVHRVQVQHEA